MHFIANFQLKQNFIKNICDSLIIGGFGGGRGYGGYGGGFNRGKFTKKIKNLQKKK